ncbi:hypothetical protein [Pinibacter soli]|uniref:Uncharacterized protein n=1 Tax=Pinibacter soli TaxID=3044211 RepID=A0ABT6RIH3_9BACT|nr:hypothetical protein [Pinibacter soli]MDI3322369.1 hypothetical protein [Pinibacter soli]
MIFCCDFFEELINEAGGKGFSVVPKQINKDGFVFVLQARSLEKEDKQGKLFVVERVIKHCPFCGSLLEGCLKKTFARNKGNQYDK